jgi:ribonuclease HII
VANLGGRKIREISNMVIPNFSREERLFSRGYKNIAGLDESGRGPLAGPVVAAAVVFSDRKTMSELLKAGVRDSKLLSSKRREDLYDIIIYKCQDWSVSTVSEEIIDRINILEATKLAMKKAVSKLKINPDFLLIDGNYMIEDYPASQVAVPKADQYIFSVSAASIVAKVTRDKILTELDKKYPGYGFAEHKGYGTKFHLEMLNKKGPCEIHRKSFRPIRGFASGFVKRVV